ncbi:hypothetical protein RHGRI_009484 [Rhododendron griersonianum]|uniref:Uncharacterized protein n=1 Tax=Rhododendron griersonianum TaxID=479676 RepID=A0AAV6KFK9_9ERIC|nr:hypothetical protein RHGRI_009484 [Rhododendron griersonianum]
MVTNGWFSSSCTRKLFSCCKVPLLAFFSKMGGFGNIGFLHTLMNKAVLVLFAWSLALEIGLLRGAVRGAVAGAIATVQLMELTVHDEPFSKVALLFGLLNGKFFMEWMAAVVQNAHQWEVITQMKMANSH